MWSLLILQQNNVLAGNNYEDRTVERYPNRKVPHPKTFNILVANRVLQKSRETLIFRDSKLEKENGQQIITLPIGMTKIKGSKVGENNVD